MTRPEKRCKECGLVQKIYDQDALRLIAGNGAALFVERLGDAVYMTIYPPVYLELAGVPQTEIVLDQEQVKRLLDKLERKTK